MTRVVKIVWIDAESTTEWTPVDELNEPQVVHTLGFLVKESDTTYFISNSIYHDDKAKLHVGDTIAIPKAWVQEIFEIKDAPKKRTSGRTKTS